jgi:hypothetical protein
MGPKVKRTMLAMTVVVFLLAACVSVPAATQDPELVQIEQTVDAALTPTPVASQQSAALLLAAQNVQATQTLTPTLNALQQTVDAMSTMQNAQSTNLADQAAQATGTAQQLATASASSLTPEPDEDKLFATPTQEPFRQCRVTILRKNSSSESFRLPDRQPLLKLKKGDGIIILQPVNLRSGPTLTHRILLTLRPDPSTTFFDPSDPNPTPTVTPKPEIIYKIIGGPAYTTIGDETGDNISFTISGRKYKWWQIELPNQTTGWIVEASACGQIQFIAKAN